MIYVIYFRALSELWACDRSESAPNGDPSVCRCHHHRCSLRSSRPLLPPALPAPRPLEHLPREAKVQPSPLGSPTCSTGTASTPGVRCCHSDSQFRLSTTTTVRVSRSSQGETGLDWKVPGCRKWEHFRVQQHLRWPGWRGSSSGATALSPARISARIWTASSGGFYCNLSLYSDSGWLIKGHILGNALSPIGPCILALSQWSHPYLVTTNRSGYNKPNFSISNLHISFLFRTSPLICQQNSDGC